MKIDKNSLFLYLVTDRRWATRDNSLEKQVEESLKNGSTFLQLREKDLDYDTFLKLALEMKVTAKKYNIPFVINDNIEVALASDADGVHIGQNDISVSKAKKLLGDDKILGVSAQTVKEAIKAQTDGADYLGVGAVFSTNTKEDADLVSFDTLKAICEAVTIPVIAIGGISENNILKLKDSKICGVAIISAILSKKNIGNATKNLVNLTKKII